MNFFFRKAANWYKNKTDIKKHKAVQQFMNENTHVNTSGNKSQQITAIELPNTSRIVKTKV